LADFRSFLVKSNALALAIGVIIGAALGTVVSSLVDDVIMPPVGRVLGGVDFSLLAIDLGGGAAIRHGAFINMILSFVIIAFVAWSLTKLFIKPAPEPAPVAMKSCPYCREQVIADATKCRYCGSELGAQEEGSRG
jgi:large conductance mechanosensitive channel